MIIECPACATRYKVPDTAIGAEGRKVRCAKCGHSWHAVAVEDDAVEAGAPEAAAPAPTPAAQVEETAAPSAASTAAPGAAGEAFETPQAGLLPDATPAAAGVRSRGIWAWAAIILAIMLGAAALAVTFWGMPDWVPGRNPTFAEAAPAELVLDFPRDQQGWRQLPNGTEIFGASGTITNAGETTRAVPPILIVLRDSRERIVYSWEVAPPRSSLPPGTSVAVNEAVTDAPRSAHFADIGWKPG
jgi:predicted Zn finger-like uncharacterized protein